MNTECIYYLKETIKPGTTQERQKYQMNTEREFRFIKSATGYQQYLFIRRFVCCQG